MSTAAPNGRAGSLADVIADQAREFRAWRNPEADFIADQLDRIAQIAIWTKATTPQEYADRLEVMDSQRDDDIHQRGYAEGFDAGLKAARRHIA